MLFIFSLDLQTQTIVGSKTHPQELKSFCQINTSYSIDNDYETNRLGFLLEHDKVLLWNTLTLSKPMVFGSKFHDCFSSRFTVRVNLYYF